MIEQILSNPVQVSGLALLLLLAGVLIWLIITRDKHESIVPNLMQQAEENNVVEGSLEDHEVNK